MKTRFAAVILAASPTLAAVPPAPSASPQVACADITDAAMRLECFDRSVAGARVPPATSAPPDVSPTAEKEPKQHMQSEDHAADTVRARISGTRKANGGVYVITLDNGQTWRHESGSMEPYLKLGEAVTISKATFGSYRLTIDSGNSKNWIRVTRVR
jgi:hypothetical protein